MSSCLEMKGEVRYRTLLAEGKAEQAERELKK